MQLSHDDLLASYRKMRTILDFEERVQKEFATGQIPGFVHLYAGEEASAVGICEQLNGVDYIGSTHRGHGHSIAKGCNVTGMMKEIYGRVVYDHRVVDGAQEGQFMASICRRLTGPGDLIRWRTSRQERTTSRAQPWERLLRASHAVSDPGAWFIGRIT